MPIDNVYENRTLTHAIHTEPPSNHLLNPIIKVNYPYHQYPSYDQPPATSTYPTPPVVGVKHDSGKVRYDLLPPELLHGVADIFTFGAEKYSARNWEQGMSWGRWFAALMRHMWAWWGGQKVDGETGKSHLWHAGCCLAVLIAYEERNIGTDDRNKV